ncbi:MAG TPA: hypothetical protein VNB49_01975 [Candidatus Dormibacteraeota bacterium]|nr:hypothetical protein [Candidatus Dormibacteraeota bacterium]
MAIFIVILAVGGASWFGLKRIRCTRRSAAFTRQIESIKRDARAQLKVGANKADVARFFVEHGIPFDISESQATGTLRTSGCAPLGCGTDSAIIGVRVKLNGTGAVTDEPTVVGMYTDCL